MSVTLTVAAVVGIAATLIGMIGSIVSGASQGMKEKNAALYNQAVNIVNSLQGDISTWKDQITSKVGNAIYDMTGTRVQFAKLNNEVDKMLRKLQTKSGQVKQNVFSGYDSKQSQDIIDEANNIKNKYQMGLAQIKEIDRQARYKPLIDTHNQIQNEKSQLGNTTITQAERTEK